MLSFEEFCKQVLKVPGVTAVEINGEMYFKGIGLKTPAQQPKSDQKTAASKS